MEKKQYHFTAIKAKRFNIINDKRALEYLSKWSMKGQILLTTFSFNEPYESHRKSDFARDFLTNAEVIDTIARGLPEWSYTKEEVEDVDIESVPCKQTSLAFFDRLLDPENEIVLKGGSLHGCNYYVLDGISITTKLREMLIDENSDHFGLYNEEERKELLFRLLQHLVVGGEWCQYEDAVEPYMDMVKMLYKDLVEVERNAGTKEIRVRSVCLKVTIRAKKKAIFPKDADMMQNFAYLLIDPAFRHATLFAHEYGGQF